ncbi:asparaginase [Thermococcus litoralis DSM 5473]|uniref:L-asparaginase n=2 Tax=Thermococcus litoralis TaxID=2265 RepID=H3ZJL8_THELN|nr:asparaginase [Thermococcus litoralis]EHR79842.2 asparaginase [Thermococcus litoralis DSM 5473]
MSEKRKLERRGAEDMKRILIIGTGGTIASAKTDAGFKSVLTIDEILEKADIKLKNGYEIDTRNILNIDSTLIQPEDWERIAKEVYKALEDYDGIVITHGTDTLAYTASMLTFMIRGINKPVVLTGSMRPVTEEESDAPRNLKAAIRFAMEDVSGIFVAFMDKIMLGCRTSKIRALGLNAFMSINYPDVAYVKGEEVIYNLPQKRFKPKGEPVLDTKYEPRVVFIRLTPGLDGNAIDALVKAGYRGIVLEGYGAGGIPYRKRDILSKIREITPQIPVVMTTQALYDGVDLTKYEVGRKALEAGIIPAKDMTKETTITKLMWALGHTKNVEEVKEIMHTNYADEIEG